MTTSDRLSDIAETLSKILENGLSVSADTLHFAESTYGISGAELASTLRDEGFEDRDILVNLLLFPTREMRLRLEPLLAGRLLAGGDLKIIGDQVFENVRFVSFDLPDDSVFVLDVREEAVHHLVKKYYMDRQFDPIIVSALDTYLPEDQNVCVKVFLRCSNFSFSGMNRRFLCLALEKSAGQSKIDADVIELLFTTAAQVPQQKTIVEYLFEQREYQTKLLNDIREFEKKSNQYGMEYLMMQNYPVPHESEENVSQLLRKFTIIIDDLLILRNPKDDYISRQDLGSFGTDNDLDRLFRSLS